MAVLDNINLRNPWVIGGIVVVGVGIAIFVLPRLRQGIGAGTSGTSGPNESAASQTDSAGGQPIIVVEEQQYTPPGASPGTAVAPTPPSGGPVPTGPAGSPTGPGGIKGLPDGANPPILGPGQPPRNPNPSPQAPPMPPMQFVHPSAWPQAQSSLASIAQAHGLTLSRLESFPENQYIRQRPGGWNLIYPSDTIRVA